MFLKKKKRDYFYCYINEKFKNIFLINLNFYKNLFLLLLFLFIRNFTFIDFKTKVNQRLINLLFYDTA